MARHRGIAEQGDDAGAVRLPAPLSASADQGGYPYWHCEQYPRDAQCEALHRVLLWTLYLNDDFDEGETEFLFQQRKVRPAVGTMVIAPAAFTHTHRGNRPRGGDKFIATSWVLFRRAEQLFVQG